MLRAENEMLYTMTVMMKARLEQVCPALLVFCFAFCNSRVREKGVRELTAWLAQATASAVSSSAVAATVQQLQTELRQLQDDNRVLIEQVRKRCVSVFCCLCGAVVVVDGVAGTERQQFDQALRRVARSYASLFVSVCACTCLGSDRICRAAEKVMNHTGATEVGPWSLTCVVRRRGFDPPFL
jgi:hypothetical protein